MMSHRRWARMQRPRVGWEVIARLGKEANVAQDLVFLETVDGLPDFVDGEGALL